ncbi:molybdate transport system substrate-binding protein [Desulfurella multipotens]|uniref:Molybdate transport system substrate-binding protein n=1 Tax=Desulfurella multipotens TaxID=79269 RepID=A0A1G6J299_9BACT|nr:molybdate ABC transporter substrate-binding protein [Desulfurella multipotens]SDC12861.1 molybdate transport system substrate-binding protein [Desulfurella multipotens]
MLRHNLFVIFAFLFFCNVSFASKLVIVYTPSMQGPIKTINSLFEKQNGNIEITAIPIIAGAAFEQIKNGYPADIFISADTMYPKKLIEEGFALENSYFVYAKGVLALYSNLEILNKQSCLENVSKFQGYIGIINPKLGPYGKATMQALENSHLLYETQKRFAQGKDALQVLQFAQTKSVSMAFLPLSLVINEKSGNYCIVDKKLYLPINQAMVILKSSKNKNDAFKYLEFMKSNKVKEILKTYGFEA